MYLILGSSTAKEMWEYFDKAYLEANKYKEFQHKQQLLNIMLGTKKLDEYIKEFKGICVGLAAIHKIVDEYPKVINFDKGLGSKYRTIRAIMLGNPLYTTFKPIYQCF